MEAILDLYNRTGLGPYHIKDNSLYAGSLKVLTLDSKYGYDLLRILESLPTSIEAISQENRDLQARVHVLEEEVSRLEEDRYNDDPDYND